MGRASNRKKAQRWAKDSLGDRFFSGTFLDRARSAPCLATAQIPGAAVITADPAHWDVAADALIRAVVFDGLGLDHPAVSTLLEILAPVAEAEVAYHEAADAAMYGAANVTPTGGFHGRCAAPQSPG